MRTTLSALVLAAASTLAVERADARELHWRALDVEARLEPDGHLRVVETQTLIFTGDWNGGERRFRLRGGQGVELVRLTRVDPASGAEVELRRGALAAVDEYDWHDRRTLRWRSRLPSDPPFDGTELVYRLELLYHGILRDEGGGAWVLDHDFAFTERDGPIERLTWRLELAPVWTAEERLPFALESGPLAPGEGFVVTRRLRFTGATAPAAAAPARIPIALRWAALALFAGAALERLLAWRRRDRALGRFEPLPDPGEGAHAWLEEKVFCDAPEVIGAAWDRAVGSAEVAATLARLVAEGKLEARVERSGWGIFASENLHLRRRVDVEAIDDGARPLVRALFPAGEETDTASLRAHYRSSGFDPTAIIRAGLDRRVAALGGFASGASRPRRAPGVALLVAGLALVAWGAASHALGGVGVGLGAFLIGVSIPGFAGAGVGRSRVGPLGGPLAAIAVSLSLQLALLALASLIPGLPWVSYLGVVLLATAFARSFFNGLATRDSAAALARRRELAAARAWLRRELGRPRPRLEDRWFPWLVAFGLTPELDRWFRGHGAAVRAVPSTSSWSGGGAAGGGGWSGGGGAFGGAGATASFAAAVSTIAAGVARPGSGGSSGGGGGGGSSGGGGGGGW
jgi:hypothetical protein